MLLRKRFLSLAAVASLAIAGTACDDGGTEEPLEETGDTVEEGVEDTGDTLEEGGEEMEEETTEEDS